RASYPEEQHSACQCATPRDSGALAAGASPCARCRADAGQAGQALPATHKPRENEGMDSDLALLQSWRAGNKQAGEDLFTRHFTDIYRFFEHKAGDAADELAQQTFMACVAGRDSFRGQSTFRTFLFAIARNQLYSYLRRASQRAQVD